MKVGELNKAISSINKIKRDSISPLMKNIAYRPTFNIDCYREAVLHRFVDLMKGAATSLENAQYISALISARAAQETFSVLAYINFKLERFESDKDLAALLDITKRLSIGWKGDAEFPEMINVLTCVDFVNKKLDPNFRRLYDILSESAHPNYSGVLGSYSLANHDTLEVKVGLNKDAEEGLYENVTSTILICSILFTNIQGSYESLLNKTLDICIELHEKGMLSDIFHPKT